MLKRAESQTQQQGEAISVHCRSSLPSQSFSSLHRPSPPLSLGSPSPSPTLFFLRRVWIFTHHVFFLGRTCGNISTCASESDPLDLRRPGVWGRGEAAERQYGHALSSHALHSRPRCRHGLPRWSCARPPRAHFAPGFLRRRKQDSMVGSVLDAHSGFRGKCALVFAAMVSVVLSSG